MATMINLPTDKFAERRDARKQERKVKRLSYTEPPKYQSPSRGFLDDSGYNFIDKHPAIDQLRTLIESDGRSLTAIANAAEIAPRTLHGYFYGNTRAPQAPTLNKVGRVFGKRLGWVDL